MDGTTRLRKFWNFYLFVIRKLRTHDVGYQFIHSTMFTFQIVESNFTVLDDTIFACSKNIGNLISIPGSKKYHILNTYKISHLNRAAKAQM